MLAFPAPRWQDALVSHAKSQTSSDRPPSNTFGRTVTPIIPDRLYLCDYYSAGSPEILQNLGITHIISVMEQTNFSLPEEMEERLKRVHVPVADRADAEILHYFQDTTAIIQKALEDNKDNKVLVHCLQGISRSATIVCAYLVATKGLTATKSIQLVQSKRGIVCPNMGFRKQLEMYATRFVGRKGLIQANVDNEAGRVGKMSEGIAERIRWLKEQATRGKNVKDDG